MAFISMKYKLKMAAVTSRKLLQVSKLCRIFHRNFVINISNNLSRHAAQAEEVCHIYKQPMNNRDVINYLVKNVVFEDDNWIVSNKPYGIGWQKPTSTIHKYNARTVNDVYLKEILPLLAQEFNVKSLDLIFSPERFTSGVTVFGKTKESVEKFKNLHSAEIKRSALKYGFIAVTLFEPVPKSGEKRFKLCFDKNTKILQIVNSKKGGTGAIVVCRHEVKDISKFCSLVEVKASKLVNNCVSEYLEKGCLSPVLGEVMFNSAVGKIGDISFPVTADTVVKDFKNLDPELLAQLKVGENEVSLIPKHLHLKSLTLRIRKTEEFFVSVPPPESFLWTCNRLNLSINKS